ncbi:MAG TPA: MarR family transcriptional regulator [Actinomycetes bacterium]|nr:MarR family transcriptional regulator [Actinomycetes bacterium]
MTEPRWLSDDEQQTWRAVISLCTLLPNRLGRDLQVGHQLSLPDYEILVRLSECPKRQMRMSDLATVTLSSRSRLSHQVTRMEQAGLVRREECRTDRRGWLAVLTDEGLERLKAAAPDHVETVRTVIFDELSDADQAALGRICRTLADKLQADV